jgi:hypothetical protein
VTDVEKDEIARLREVREDVLTFAHMLSNIALLGPARASLADAERVLRLHIKRLSRFLGGLANSGRLAEARAGYEDMRALLKAAYLIGQNAVLDHERKLTAKTAETSERKRIPLKAQETSRVNRRKVIELRQEAIREICQREGWRGDETKLSTLVKVELEKLPQMKGKPMSLRTIDTDLGAIFATMPLLPQKH